MTLDSFVRASIIRGEMQITCKYGRFAKIHGLTFVRNYTDRWHLCTDRGDLQIRLKWITHLFFEIARKYARHPE
jgi:hypothetical protein